MNKKNKVSYDDIADIVEKIVEQKAQKYMFDCHEVEDIAQIIRMKCFELLPKFHPKRLYTGNAINFFGKCIDHLMINYIRDNYFRFEIPCKAKRCVFYEEDEGCISEPMECKSWVKYQNNLIAHAKIHNATRVDFSVEDSMNSVDICYDTFVKDVFEYTNLVSSIRQKAELHSPYLLKQFNRLLDGFKIKHNDIRKIRSITMSVIFEK